MKKRVITGLAILAVYLGCGALTALVHPVFFNVTVFALVMIACLEMNKAVGSKFRPPYALLTCIAAVLAFGGYITLDFLLHSRFYSLLGFFGVLLLTFVVLFIVSLSAKGDEQGRIYSTMFVIVYPVGISGFLLGLSSFYTVDAESGFILLLNPIALTIFITCFSDMAAFFVGSTFKGPKLAPVISPKKTISGAIGGLFGGIAGAATLYLLESLSFLGLDHIFPQNIPLCVALIFIYGVLGSILTQAGDLFASFVKRTCGVKDYGSILPGHGGIMDRIDGLLFCAVFVHLFTSILLIIV